MARISSCLMPACPQDLLAVTVIPACGTSHAILHNCLMRSASWVNGLCMH